MQHNQLNQLASFIWNIADRVQRLIAEDIPARVAADGTCQNAMMKNNDKQNAPYRTRQGVPTTFLARVSLNEG